MARAGTPFCRRAPDGHKIEATYWDVELAKKLGMM